ncbi:MAG: response regulator transcription factor [Bacteroidales bacterium]|nr:response regulator transcription factor [Bacteroidales bacterium]
MEQLKILYAEDEDALGLIVKDSLESRKFEVDYFKDGKSALESFYKNKYHILVLDVMMPELDGFSLAKEVRKTDKTIPIIFLTAKSQTSDVIEGFELGGNDYLKKPFSIEELIVRIKSLTSRSFKEITKEETLSDISIGQYQFNYTQQSLSINSNIKKLTHRETELLKRLHENKNDVLDRKAVLLELWGDDSFFNARSMDVFITKLRRYFKDDPSIQIINVRAVGYKLIC